MPLISVVVPVYNVEQYLPRCLDSILAQTFSNFELILVDDGSVDNCGAICDEYARKHNCIRVVHQKNSGVSVARNTALDLAQGQYVAFCDSDDFWEPNLLEVSINTMTSEQADCVLFGFNTYTDDGLVKSHIYATGCYEFSSDKDTVDYLIRTQLSIKHGWEMCFHMFSRYIIEKYHIRCCTTCNNFAEDMGFVCRYMLHSKRIVSIPCCLYNYYLRKGSLMRTNGNNARLNDVNEVSYYISQDFYETIHAPTARRQYPIIHFLIASYQLNKFCTMQKTDRIPNEISKLDRIDWWNQNIKSLFFCYKDLKRYYNSYSAKCTLMFAAYLQHGNWGRYCFEKKLMRLPKYILRVVVGSKGYETLREKIRKLRKGRP